MTCQKWGSPVSKIYPSIARGDDPRPHSCSSLVHRDPSTRYIGAYMSFFWAMSRKFKTLRSVGAGRRFMLSMVKTQLAIGF